MNWPAGSPSNMQSTWPSMRFLVIGDATAASLINVTRSPAELSWLRTPRPYSMPDERNTLRPRLAEDRDYIDGSKGSIEFYGRGRFRVPIKLSNKTPGIYTIVVWIQKFGLTTPFPATQVCVRAE